MSDDAGESTADLKAKIRQLQNEVNDVRAENSLLKMKVHSGDPLLMPAPLHTHEFKIEMKDTMDTRSEAHSIDGVELSVRIEKLSKGDSPYGRDIKFASTLYVKNLDPSKQKFALTTIEVREKERYTSLPRFTTILKPVGQRFVLCSSGGEEDVGYRKTFNSQSDQSTYTFHVKVTVAVQQIASMDLEDGEMTTVVIKGREFSVSSQYLSLWSNYFRAYFRADMKEKKAGRYPIKDKDITPEDFEELLMVIYPTDKPITTHNYKKLLKLASRFEMPELTRRVECFLIDFERNELDRASVFRLATDTFHLKLVQLTLLHRWRDSALLQNELLKSPEYEKLKVETKALINERFAQACIAKEGGANASPPSTERGDHSTEDDEDEDSPYFDEDEDGDYFGHSDEEPY